MPLHSYFVLALFTILLAIFLLRVIGLKSAGSGFLGTPTIEKLYFYGGKTAAFVTWGLFMLKALMPQLGYLFLPAFCSWIAVGILFLGIFFLSSGMISLGKSLKVGLPGEDTALRTGGLFRISRNPIYFGVHLISIASCIYFLDLLNLTFTIFSIYQHHKIIREEERFLSDRFGEQWTLYTKKVPRYI